VATNVVGVRTGPKMFEMGGGKHDDIGENVILAALEEPPSFELGP
jgi:hypothetical protein